MTHSANNTEGEALAYTTDILSWGLLLSALHRVQATSKRDPRLNLNLEAAPCVILTCDAIEAFINEVSSITYCFLFERERDAATQRPDRDTEPVGINEDSLRTISEIRLNGKGSFFDRYNRLLKPLGIMRPQFQASLCTLKDVRDALVHFRSCDVPVTDQEGSLGDGQDLPPSVKHLEECKYQGVPVLASDIGAPWTRRMATDAMAAWSLELGLNAAKYVLTSIPEGRYRDMVGRKYAHVDRQFDTVVHFGQIELAKWWMKRCP
jgi:hypothetical protein